MTEMDRGIAEFFRELPGLLLVVVLAVLYNFSAEKMYKLGMCVMVIGMTMQALISPTKALVILAIFIYSHKYIARLSFSTFISKFIKITIYFMVFIYTRYC